MADSGEMLDEVRSRGCLTIGSTFYAKGGVVDLPAGSTPLDFAYHVQRDVGHRCIGAKVVGASYRLPTSYRWAIRLRVSLSRNSQISRDWLNPNTGYVTTSRGRSKSRTVP